MMYRRFCSALNDYGTMIPADESPSKHGAKLGTPNNEYYTSIYKYNDTQVSQFKKTGSVAGIHDLKIDKLVFDFDGKIDDIPAPELAHNDAIEICNRLIKLGFNEKDIRIFFSGASGFHVEICIDEDISSNEFKAITRQLANGLNTFDKKIYNPSRIFRVVGSINFKTNLYKIPLTFDELKESIENIKERAKSFSVDRKKFNWDIVTLPKDISDLKKFSKDFKVDIKHLDTSEIDWTRKPKWISNCRYSLQSGNFGFEPGERNDALMCLGATYRNQGFELDHNYRLLKAVAQKQSDKSGRERFSDDEIYNNIILTIYSPDWKNGQYSCREKGSWLADYCESLGPNKCKHREDESTFIEIEHFADKFSNFATNIEQNTLKFGIKEIDNYVLITTSMVVALLGAPSAGKTTLWFNFMEQANKDKIDNVFFSMDMGLPLVYLRLIQRHFGYTKDEVFEIWKHDQNKMIEIIEVIKEKYKYTKFSFKTGLNVEGMREATLDHEQKIGRPVKLIGVDYLERVRGPYSDPTANSGQVANELTDLANDHDKCVMLLTQTQKQSGDPSDPLLSMRNIKGASLIEQAASNILTLSRPGFSPTRPEDDKFATISLVKGRLDTLFTKDLGWNGLRGSYSSLADEDRQLLFDIRNRKSEEKKQKNDGWGP